MSELPPSSALISFPGEDDMLKRLLLYKRGKILCDGGEVEEQAKKKGKVVREGALPKKKGAKINALSSLYY